MRYRQFTPGARAERFVECYWTLDDPDPNPADIQRVVPDGTCELILNLHHPFEQFCDGEWETQPRTFFAGQITGPLLIRPRGPVKMLGVRFRPHGASHVFRTPLDELTGSICPLDDLSTGFSREIERLAETESVRADRIETALLKFEGAGSRPDAVVAEAVRRIVAAGGNLDVSMLAARLGISLRQFERRFRAAVGLSPKLFCRMQRFQRVFHAIEDGGWNWVDVAIECGYFDQAHLIRDFRDFAGKPPSALLAEADLARHFLRYTNGVSHFSKTGIAVSL